MSHYKKWSEIRRSKGAVEHITSTIEWMRATERLYAALQATISHAEHYECEFPACVEARAVLKSFE